MNPRYKRTLSWALPITAAILFVLSVGWVYSRNTLFRFNEVEVTSQDLKVETWVKNRLVRYLGQSLFTIPLKQVETDLLQMRQIKKVNLRRHWPSKISVELELRRPLALIWNQRTLWMVDRDGVLFQKMTEAHDLPILRGFSLEKLTQSDWTLEGDSLGILTWIDSLMQSEEGVLGFKHIDEIVWQDERGLLLKSFENDLTLELGRQDFDGAWKRSLKAYAFFKSKGLRIVNLDASYRSRVVGVLQPGTDFRVKPETNVGRDVGNTIAPLVR